MNVAVLVDIIKETDKNWRFVFEDPLHSKLDYVSGQLVQLVMKPGLEGSAVRNYSVSSWANGTNTFELIITYLEGGVMSEYLFKEAEIGAEFLYRGPLGVFTLPKDLTKRDIYLVSTGSGISPFRSMINYIYENKVPFKSIKLFFGTRKQQDILYREELEYIDNKLTDFEFIPVLSRELDWGGATGYVHQHYLASLTQSNEKPLFYFCGWDKMIADGREKLASEGYKMGEDIKVEIFG